MDFGKQCTSREVPYLSTKIVEPKAVSICVVEELAQDEAELAAERERQRTQGLHEAEQFDVLGTDLYNADKHSGLPSRQ